MNEIKDKIPDKIKILKALDQDIRENKKIDTRAGYRQTLVKIKKQSRKVLFYHILNRAAAILVIPLLLSTLIFMYLFLDKEDNTSLITYTEISAAPGTIIKTQLPDKSDVWLNSGSKLRYPSSFSGKKRMVELSGEAFFEVKTDPDCPFEVEAPSGMKVLAKGTAFNINAYADDPVHEASLLYGIIDVLQNTRSISVSPNEMITLDRQTGQLKKTVVNMEEKTGWKDGVLIFRNTPLDEVFKRLARRYNVEFTVHNRSNANYRIRATFSTETITQILDVLKIATPIEWTVKDTEQQSDFSYSKQHIEVVIN